MQPCNRREFLTESAALAAGASAVAATGAQPTSAQAADDQLLPVALIGCGGMGTNHLRQLVQRKEVRLAYVCDVDANRLAAAAKLVETAGAGQPQAVSDLRQVLADPRVRAVWIATPDHWHTPAALLACAAKKHVYVEKPVSHNVREGRLLIEAARKHNVVVQVGTQGRSTPHVREALDQLRRGAIGEVLAAKAWNSQLRSSIGVKQVSSPPPHLDFDAWLGPAPARPYQENLLHGVWRFWRDFGAGDIGNDGVHEIDIARWGLGVSGLPTQVAAMGSKYFFKDDQQFPDHQYCLYEWSGDGQPGNKRQLIYEQRDWSPYVQEGYENGNAFYGTKGLLILGKGGGYKLFGPRNKLLAEGAGSPDLPAHHQNFLDCLKSGQRPHADVEEGHYSAALAHLGNIACFLGRTLRIDPAAEAILGDAEAHALLGRSYRNHWAAPAG